MSVQPKNSITRWQDSCTLYCRANVGKDIGSLVANSPTGHDNSYCAPSVAMRNPPRSPRKSATKKHGKMGNVDVKMGLYSIDGSVLGVEVGARNVMWLTA